MYIQHQKYVIFSCFVCFAAMMNAIITVNFMLQISKLQQQEIIVVRC